MREVDPEEEREAVPDCNREDRPRQCRSKSLPYIRSQEINEFDGDDRKADGDRPPQCGPDFAKYGGESELRCEPVTEAGSNNDDD